MCPAQSSSPPSAADRVFAAVRDAILSGSLEAGSRHSVYRLAAEHDVSRTPVREAVLRLADSGLVSIERNRGFVVRSITTADVREVFELRLLLEVPAAAWAAGHLDTQLADALRRALADLREAASSGSVERFEACDRALHAIIDGAPGNGRLAQEVGELRSSVRARGAVTVDRSRTVEDVLEDHEPIVAAILAEDPAAAADAMRTHLVRTATLLIDQLSDDPPDVRLWPEDVALSQERRAD